uniref:Uncharacterized protein n=1 Tax=Anguilla anguilla TaxID=7936 RepID=A0A0E9STM4_ANGAN
MSKEDSLNKPCAPFLPLRQFRVRGAAIFEPTEFGFKELTTDTKRLFYSPSTPL